MQTLHSSRKSGEWCAVVSVVQQQYQTLQRDPSSTEDSIARLTHAHACGISEESTCAMLGTRGACR